LRSIAVAVKMKRLDDERRRLAEENQAYQRDLERLVEERTRKLESTLQNWKDATEGTVLAMASAVESRDPYTAGHQQRVARLAQAMARTMGFPAAEIAAVYYAGLIHDLGKISVPAEILSYPGKLCNEAMGLIKKHPRTGYRVLEKVKFPWPIARIVLEHHERLDGSGYPQGLSGDQISKAARILAVADVVEAMASHRPYRPALGIDAALEEILAKRNTLYDAEAVDACVNLFKEQAFTFEVPASPYPR
jgi:putative two-component system response regulator